MMTPERVHFQARRAVRGACAVLLIGGVAACAAGDPGSTSDTATAGPATSSLAASSTTASGSAEQLYQRCVTCHQANGQGLQGAFPPLAGSEYATAANVAVPIRIVLHGMQGPVTV